VKKGLKKQIKQDDLVSGFEYVWHWVSAHAAELRITLGVLVLVGAGAWAMSYFQSKRAREAEQALAEAVQVYEAPVAAEVPEGFDDPRGPAYPSEDDKLKKAVAAFDGIERRFGSTPQARRARYYAALCRIRLATYPEAEKGLSELVAQKGDAPLEAALARLALGDLYRRQGDVDKAVDAYRQAVDDPGLPFPRDHALMNLAAILEDARRLSEAEASYRRLTEEFPTSVYAGEARRRAEYLKGAARG
jgi:tetratricopeptide (TPR) repeat protein